MLLYGINTLKQKKKKEKIRIFFPLLLGLYNGRIMIESMEPEIFGQNLLFESESRDVLSREKPIKFPPL